MDFSQDQLNQQTIQYLQAIIAHFDGSQSTASPATASPTMTVPMVSGSSFHDPISSCQHDHPFTQQLDSALRQVPQAPPPSQIRQYRSQGPILPPSSIQIPQGQTYPVPVPVFPNPLRHSSISTAPSSSCLHPFLPITPSRLHPSLAITPYQSARLELLQTTANSMPASSSGHLAQGLHGQRSALSCGHPPMILPGLLSS